MKRLIFTLLFEDGHFVMSRNFRTQRIGDIGWLNTNYDFSRVAFHIDELIILNVSRNSENLDDFCEAVRQVSRGCFAPISAGGGLRSVQDAERLFGCGADKIVTNTALWRNPHLIEKIAGRWGRQAVVASVDARIVDGSIRTYSDFGKVERDPEFLRTVLSQNHVGEIYLNSIDRDGTGKGFDLQLAAAFEGVNDFGIPLILAGGAGQPEHFLEAFRKEGVEAVATANLINFVGDGLKRARQRLFDVGLDLALWSAPEKEHT